MFKWMIVLALMLGTPVSYADNFPTDDLEPLQRDNSVTNEELLGLELSPNVEKIDYGLYALDFSAYVDLPFDTIKTAINDFEAYRCYMPKIKEGEVIAADFPGSKTNPDENVFSVKFVIGLIMDIKYYIDITTRVSTENTFGVTWQQNHALHSSGNRILDVFANHVGSWWVEPFDDQAGDRYYVRYRDWIELKLDLSEAAYKKQVNENTMIMFGYKTRDEKGRLLKKPVKTKESGLYNYNRNCL